MKDRKPVPENTSAKSAQEHILEALLFGSSAAIVRSEAEGQRQFVASDVMPTCSPWVELAALGFVRGAQVDGDPLFTHCTLPKGWSKKGSDHSMWSSIVDDTGAERVSVFYKAAFYDRKATAHIVRNEVAES